ncbi:PHOsphatase [Blyttiomyces sp. JEL0837]|nr:PHOsphatase [Blyttiomyces sp. JEL0837]
MIYLLLLLSLSLPSTLVHASSILNPPVRSHTSTTTATATDWDITRHLGSKSPYPIKSLHAEKVVAPDGCQLEHVHMFTRHGSRNPSPSDIESFKAIETLFKPDSNRIPSKYKHLIGWENPFDLMEESLLSNAGVEEMWRLGKRVRRRYQELFG